MTRLDDTAQLLDALEAFVGRYVVLPGEHEAAALTAWIAHTHAIEAAAATPYLLVLSPERRSGKTLLLEVLELVVAQAWRIASTSEAAMFRKIAQDGPTILLDEIDAVFQSASERTEPLRALLNAGNRRGSTVARCVGQGTLRVEDFPVFGPKLLAGIDTGKLPDTIRDRAIPVRMKRKTSAEPVARFRIRDAEPDAAQIREWAADWAGRAIEPLAAARPSLPDQLHDRAQDAWEPLTAIADLAGGPWPQRIRRAALALSTAGDDDTETHGTRLLAALHRVLGDAPAVSTEHLLDTINADEDMPYGGWRDGKGLDARGLARFLKPYGVRSRTVRIGSSTPRGYHRDPDLEEAFSRYLPSPLPEAQHAPQAQHGTDPQRQTPSKSGDVADVADVALPAGVGETLPLATPEQEAAVARALALDASQEPA